MLLNCGVGEDAWEALGLQGDQTSQFWRKWVLSLHWKDWCWNWSSNTSATWCKTQVIRKGPEAGKDWRQEEKGMTEDEMGGWHHWLNGHEFEQTPGDGEGQGSLVCFSSRGPKESDTTERLNSNWCFCVREILTWLLLNKKTKFSQTLIVHELWKLRVFIPAVTFSLPSATNTWKYAEIPMHKLRRMKFPIHYATCCSYKSLTGKT